MENCSSLYEYLNDSGVDVSNNVIKSELIYPFGKMEEYFNKTLSNFVKDFACRNEVIAKFKNKKPISVIVKELTFPISEEAVIAIIWDYLVENNIILLHEPGSDENLQYDIVRKDGELGKTYFKKVKKGGINKSDYKAINIKELKAGKSRYDKLGDFNKELL